MVSHCFGCWKHRRHISNSAQHYSRMLSNAIQMLSNAIHGSRLRLDWLLPSNGIALRPKMGVSERVKIAILARGRALARVLSLGLGMMATQELSWLSIDPSASSLTPCIAMQRIL